MSARNVPSGEPADKRRMRRCATVPLYLVLFAASTVTLAPLLAIAAVVDLVRRAPWTLTRTVAFFWYYLLCESAGIVASLVLWIADAVLPAAAEGRRARFLTWNYALQRVWGVALGRGSFAIFGIDLEVEPETGDRARSDRPILLLVRHGSTADTILAAMLVSGRRGTRLRYVLKRELLWDPCLDIVGNRLPNYFVDRAAVDTAAEIAGVGRLMDGLGAGEGVLIYPEGTRFSRAKRDRILARLEEKGDEAALARARELEAVLPPRPGGVLELLRRNESADVVFCAHSGLERSASFSEMWKGGLVGARVRVSFWREPFEAVPTDDAGRVRWLHEHWRRVDRFVRAGEGAR